MFQVPQSAARSARSRIVLGFALIDVGFPLALQRSSSLGHIHTSFHA
jgi:hypothetical protein